MTPPNNNFKKIVAGQEAAAEVLDLVKTAEADGWDTTQTLKGMKEIMARGLSLMQGEPTGVPTHNAIPYENPR